MYKESLKIIDNPVLLFSEKLSYFFLKIIFNSFFHLDSEENDVFNYYYYRGVLYAGLKVSFFYFYLEENIIFFFF